MKSLKKKIKVLSKYLFKDTLSIEDDEIRNLCINRYKIYKHKSIVDEIKEYNLFRVIEKDLIVLEPTNINFDIYSVEPNNIFLSNKENEKLFKNIKNIPENTFFDECFSFIILNYEKSKFDYLKTRLELFKRKNQNIYPENELSNETFKQQNLFLIKEIRKQVLFNEVVSLYNLIKKGFFFSKIITALKILSEEKFIAGFKSIYSLETIHLNDFLKKKLNINLSDYGITVKNNVIDEYYSYFFNYIYFLFVTKGSHQKETLLTKCDFFTENELLDFFYIFSNIFRIEHCDNSYFVELIDQ
ncbi:hypothetical protein TUBRATIS_23480 [Tubulinosema ratisbonensis]|uniref:Uncharacterized protein n=1 Tax=Tubulinosema ratisbonensis TaxID=291195 RepID=A0A437AJB5_9MICR|nr:hypothetical protein TUBRATIS_23480 [Tubulinosema ratisbonensis]